jgi:hypothetical protein
VARHAEERRVAARVLDRDAAREGDLRDLVDVWDGLVERVRKVALLAGEAVGDRSVLDRRDAVARGEGEALGAVALGARRTNLAVLVPVTERLGGVVEVTRSLRTRLSKPGTRSGLNSWNVSIVSYRNSMAYFPLWAKRPGSFW